MTDKMFMEVQDVTEMLNISEGKAYDLWQCQDTKQVKRMNWVILSTKIIFIRQRQNLERNCMTTS